MPDLHDLPTGSAAPEVVNAVVEVPLGSRNKYEYDEELGAIVRDRVLPGSVRYPADYGFIPSTVSVDGEPLDVVLAAYDGTFPGCVVQARAIGVLDLSDASGEDRTVLAVPADDPRFDEIHDVSDLPPSNLEEIERFFAVYKHLEGDEEVEIRGWLDAGEAHELIRDAMRSHEEG